MAGFAGYDIADPVTDGCYAGTSSAPAPMPVCSMFRTWDKSDPRKSGDLRDFAAWRWKRSRRFDVGGSETRTQRYGLHQCKRRLEDDFHGRQPG